MDWLGLVQYAFFRHALIGSLLASILCGLIGTYIVTRRLVFISGGITHASFGGIGIGLYMGMSPILSGAIFAILSAFGIQWMSRDNEVREDSAIAVCWTLGMAIGIICCFLTPGYTPGLTTYLFGNILTITETDLWLLASLTAMITLFFLVFANAIISIAFDRDFARSQGLPVKLLEYILMMCIALTVVSTLRMVGIVLAISMLSLPQITANLYLHRFEGICWASMGIGFLSCLLGLLISYQLQVPSGACIIFCSVLIYAGCRIERRITLHHIRRSQTSAAHH